MPHKEASKTSAANLERFLRRWNLSRERAGELLGVSERMVYWYLNGKHTVPKTVSLLMKALEENWNAKSQ
jgi:predicted transcriptional regulator